MQKQEAYLLRLRLLPIILPLPMICERVQYQCKNEPAFSFKTDREAVRQGLADGTIDVIATDHAPHSLIEKSVEFDQAANGIIGLETAVSLRLNLVEEGILTLTDLIEKMSTNPARILGLKNGIIVGKPADITIIDPEKPYH